MTIPAGWRTSEFWLHLLGLGATVATVMLGASNPVAMAIAAASALGSVVYTLSRSGVKVSYAAMALAAARAAKAAADNASSGVEGPPAAAPSPGPASGAAEPAAAPPQPGSAI